MYCAMLEDLTAAENFIFIEYFIIQEGKMWNTILNILEQKAKAGVEVRVMYDGMGCLSLLPHGYAKELEHKGIKCIPFNPMIPFISMVMNNRDHRKIMVIDGKAAFTGGVNLADEYINEIERFEHWKDTGIRLEGDSVWNYTCIFLSMWNAVKEEDSNILKYKWKNHTVTSVSGYVQPYGVSPLDLEPVGRNVYIEIINQAKNIYIYLLHIWF